MVRQRRTPQTVKISLYALLHSPYAANIAVSAAAWRQPIEPLTFQQLVDTVGQLTTRRRTQGGERPKQTNLLAAQRTAHMFPGKPIQRRDLALAPNRPNIKNRIVDAVAGLVKTIPRGTLRLHETLFHTHIRLGHIAIRLVDRLQTTGLDILAKPREPIVHIGHAHGADQPIDESHSQ